MRITVTVPDRVGEEVQRLAEEEGLSVSGIYAQAAESFVAELRKKRALEEIERLIEEADVAPGTAEMIGAMRHEDDHRTE